MSTATATIDAVESEMLDSILDEILDELEAAWCPTGPGGGQDNSCSSRDGGSADGSSIEKSINCGSDIKKAARLLSEGKYIELNQPEQVSTLLDELKSRIDEAAAKGEKSKIDLCKVSVADTNLFCQESKGIPRVEMPQMRGFPVPGSRADEMQKNAKGKVDIGRDFVDHLRDDKGIAVKETEIRASHLRASQDQLDGARVIELMDRSADDLRERPIFVTKDNYILDGHHHWAALIGKGLGKDKDYKVPVYKLDVNIGKALGIANDFMKETGIAPKSVAAAFCNTGEGQGQDNSCPPANKGAGESKTEGDNASKGVERKQSALVRRIEKTAASVTFSEGSPEATDPSDAIDNLIPSQRSEMEQWVSERVMDAWDRTDHDIYIDDDDVLREADATQSDIENKVSEIVSNPDLAIDDGKRAELDTLLVNAVTTGGVDGVDEALSEVASQAEDQEGEINPYVLVEKELSDYRDEVESSIETAREDLERAASDEAYDDFYTGYDRSALEREWLEDNGHYDSSGMSPEDREDNTWYTDDDDADLVFHTSDGSSYEVKAIGENIDEFQGAEIQFRDESGSVEITGHGNAHEVFRKVVPATVAYIREQDLDFATFSAADQSRIDLYDKLAKTVAAVLPEYKVVYKDSGREHRYYAAAKRGKYEDIKEAAKSSGFDYSPEFREEPTGEIVGSEPPPAKPDDNKSVSLPFSPDEWTEVEPEIDPAWFTEEYWKEQEQNAAWCPGSPPDNSCSPANKGTGAEKDSGGDKSASETKKTGERYQQKAITEINDKIAGFDKEIASLDAEFAKMEINRLQSQKELAQQSLKSLTQSPPDLKAEWNGVSEKIDKMIDEKVAAKAEVSIPHGDSDEADEEDTSAIYQSIEENLTYDDLGGAAQNEAFMAYLESGDASSEAYAEASEQVKESVKEDIEKELESVDYTIQVLQEHGDEFGIDPTTYEMIAKKDGDIDPMYIAFTDGTYGPAAEDRWKEMNREWVSTYMDAYKEEKELRLEDSFGEKGDEPSDKISDLITEASDEIELENWNQKTDSEKMDYVSNEGKQDAIQTVYEQGDWESFTGNLETGIKTGVLEKPSTYTPFKNERNGDYEKTRSVARFVQMERTDQILVERGLPSSPLDIKEIDSKVWSAWKGKSQSDLGQVMQLAVADELGSVGRADIQVDRYDLLKRAGMMHENADGSINQDKYERMKAYVRGTWESSQHVLEKAGVEKVDTWRAIYADTADIEATTLEKVEGYYTDMTRLPDLEILRNSAQSATTLPSVSNGWGGIHPKANQERVVLRITTEPTAVLSLPVHGVNITSEEEIVLTGNDWSEWDAWRGRAPETGKSQGDQERASVKTAA